MKLPEIEKEAEEMRPFLDREPRGSNGAAKAQKTATAAENGQNRTEAALTGTETGRVGKDANPAEKETRPFGLNAKTRTELQSLRPQAQQAANEYAAAEAAAAEERSWTRVLKTPEAQAGLRRWYEDLGFHEIDGLARASEVGEFLETEYGTFSEAGDRYRALMKKVIEETATEEERKQYDRLCRRRMYAEDRKETLTAYEADRQYREEKARYESPLGRADLRASVEAGLEADGNPLTGSVLSALSPRVFRTKTYTTTDEKILISYYYGQSKAKGDEYVEWLDKHELKERDRSAKVNAITKLAKAMPINPLLPVPTKYWVAATSGVERFVLGGYNLVAGITGGETVEGILTGAYNQLLQDENWASKKLMKLTNTLGNAAPKVAIGHFMGASAAYGAYAASSMGNKYHQAKSTGYTEPEAWLYAGITTGVEMAMGHKLGQQGGGQLGRMIDEALRGITRSPRGRAVLNLTAEKAGGLTGRELQKYFGGTLAPVVRDVMQSEGTASGDILPETERSNRHRKNSEREKQINFCIKNENPWGTKGFRFFGGDEGIRTLDPYVANVMLSQLSYTPMPQTLIYYTTILAFVKSLTAFFCRNLGEGLVRQNLNGVCLPLRRRFAAAAASKRSVSKRASVS